MDPIMLAIALATTLCVILIAYAGWLCVREIDGAPEYESDVGASGQELQPRQEQH